MKVSGLDPQSIKFTCTRETLFNQMFTLYFKKDGRIVIQTQDSKESLVQNRKCPSYE